MAEFAFQFWSRVDKISKEKGISVKDLSNAIGVSYDVMRQWRSKNRYPKGEIPMDIASRLGVSVEFLLSGKDQASITLDDLCEEARYVQDNPEIRPIVRLIMRDKDAMSHISALVELGMNEEKQQA